jgi:hypothetical protein
MLEWLIGAIERPAELVQARGIELGNHEGTA